jgi:hypothetical protein
MAPNRIESKANCHADGDNGTREEREFMRQRDIHLHKERERRNAQERREWGGVAERKPAKAKKSTGRVIL